MKKKNKYITYATITCIALFSIGGLILAMSCRTAKSVSTIELPPAYSINVPSTPQPIENERFHTITLASGSSIAVPVIVTSLSDVSIHVRIILTPEAGLPDSITYQTPKEYTSIEPGKSATIPVTLSASESTVPGTYGMSAFGSLKNAVKGRNLSAQIFMLVVTEK